MGVAVPEDAGEDGLLRLFLNVGADVPLLVVVVAVVAVAVVAAVAVSVACVISFPLPLFLFTRAMLLLALTGVCIPSLKYTTRECGTDASPFSYGAGNSTRMYLGSLSASS